MERILPGFADECKSCAKLLEEADPDSGVPCKAAYETDCGFVLNPTITNDRVKGFNCESYRERWSLTSALADFVRNGAKEIYTRFFVQANRP